MDNRPVQLRRNRLVAIAPPDSSQPYSYTDPWLDRPHFTAMSDLKIDAFLREAIDSLIPTPKFDKSSFSQALKDHSNPRVLDILVDVLESFDTFIHTHSSPHRPLFLDLVNNDVLSLESIAERFSAATIASLKFTPGVDFAKRYRVQRTNLLYKQKKFNLIREESEGYAKLIVELSNMTASPAIVIDRIQSLIGYFDLSPARVLDILFDVYSSNLLEGYSFFCDLCKLSPWWPETLASEWKVMSNEQRLAAMQSGIAPSLTTTGSSDRASQIMGFKFQGYHDSDEETPMRLSLLAAILIKEGMIDLKIIYKHAAPEAKPSFQKISLLKSLLAVGALPESLFILSQYPWLPSFDPEIADLMNKLINHTIEPLYSTIRPLNGLEIFSPKKRPTDKKAGELHLVDPAKPIGYRISNPLPKGPNERFFYREWDQEIPVIHTFEEFHRVIVPLLRFPGCLLSRDVFLLHKLVRLGIREISILPTQSPVWQDLVRTFVLPSLSLQPTNAGLTNLVWELLASFPYTTRFGIYGTWSSSYKSIPELKIQFAQTEKEAKGILKRLSKETTRQTSRTFPKLIHSNPIVVFGVVLGQIQAYDNLSETVVEVARYLGPMGYDVFAYVLLSLLSTDDKRRLKDDGTNLGHWLQSLSSFAGKVYKRYPAMDVSLPLEYVVWQLKSGQTFDLVVLKELLINLSGVDSIVNLSDAQIKDVSGGAVLKEVFLKDVFWKEKDRSKKSSARLSKCHEIMILFADFIANSLWENYSALVPSISTFLGEWGVDPESAFYFLRPVMLENIREWDTNETIRIQREALLKKRAENGIEVEEGEDSGGGKDDVLMVRSSFNLPTNNKESGNEGFPFHPALKSFFQDAEKVLPEEPEFFILFWQLDISDIHVPLARYAAAKDKLASQIRTLDVPAHLLPTMTGREKEDLATKKSDFNRQLLLLTDESKRLVRSFEKTRKRFNLEKDHWFRSKLPGERINVAEFFIQHCVFPRAKFSPKDAIFAARFIKQLHALGTPNFPTLVIYDDIFNERFASIIPTFSQYEADNYGRFVAECLAELMLWHKDESLFNKEGRGKNLPGFYKRGLIRIDDNEPAEEKAKRLLTYEEFRAVMFKWSMKLEKSVKVCLASKEYMRIRNTLVILGNIAHVWPANDEHGDHVITYMEELLAEEKADDSTEEKRQDIITRGDGCLGLLKKNKDRWIPREEFSLASIWCGDLLTPGQGYQERRINNGSKCGTKSKCSGLLSRQLSLVSTEPFRRPANGTNGTASRTTTMQTPDMKPPPTEPLRSRAFNDPRRDDNGSPLRPSRPHDEWKRDEDRRGRLINSREPSPRRTPRSDSRNRLDGQTRPRDDTVRLSRSVGGSPRGERSDTIDRPPSKQQTSEELEASLRAQLKNKDSPTLFKEPPSQPRLHNQHPRAPTSRIPPSGPASTRNEAPPIQPRIMGTLGSSYRPETWVPGSRDHPSCALLLPKPAIEARLNGKEVFWEGKRDDREKEDRSRDDRRDDRDRKDDRREFMKADPIRPDIAIRSRPPSRGENRETHRSSHRDDKREISRTGQPRNRDFPRSDHHHRTEENSSRRESLVGISIRGTGAPRDERERRRDEDRREDSRHETIIREPRREERRHHRRRSKSPERRERRKHEREEDRQGVSKRRKTDR
ncbi:THO complex subunit 2 [Neolecta irregularis DAH-3]|uniref:THO complex subunit 2 n=1 Tax=Neolecta irregularis (strain DAH-3) TaxID=1198029 RepID=A0A1U7LWP2_NEOID|nr:THO complex subunit 2 [Neolecta irregularis DAH-3]|eukprot:OLL27038.1 THO complex subunit 2 [Neolecta irregularis DAH-3]